MNSKKRSAEKPKSTKTKKPVKNAAVPQPGPVETPADVRGGKIDQQPDARFTRIMDYLLEGCTLIGFDWTCLYLNEIAAQHIQDKHENLIGRNMLEIFPDHAKMPFFPHYRQCMEERIPQQFEEPITFPDGKTCWYRFNVEPVPEGIFVLSLDITERKLSEEALRESEERWRSLVSATPDFIALHDREGHYLFLNHFAQGFTEKDVIGTTLYQYLLPESVELFRSHMEIALDTWTVQNFEYRGLGVGGSTRLYEESLVPMRDKNQEVTILAVARDITQRKHVEEELKLSEEKFRLSFMTALDAVYWSTLEEGRIIEVNPVFKDMFGYTREEAIGKTSLQLGLYYDPVDRGKMIAELKAKGQVKDLELKGKKKDGKIITVSLSTSRMSVGEQEYIIGVIRDITERKRGNSSGRSCTRFSTR